MADRNKTITIGEAAPDFTLKDQKGKEFSLSKQKGKRVLLSFQPLAWTPICQNQMRALEEHFEILKALNTVPVGLSIDSMHSKKAWAESMGLKNLKLLADFWPHGGVAKQYGLFREQDGYSERANVIVDGQGKVAWVKVYEISQLPDLHEVIEILEKLK
jgi:peroxiredoxin